MENIDEALMVMSRNIIQLQNILDELKNRKVSYGEFIERTTASEHIELMKQTTIELGVYEKVFRAVYGEEGLQWFYIMTRKAQHENKLQIINQLFNGEKPSL